MGEAPAQRFFTFWLWEVFVAHVTLTPAKPLRGCEIYAKSFLQFKAADAWYKFPFLFCKPSKANITEIEKPSKLSFIRSPPEYK